MGCNDEEEEEEEGIEPSYINYPTQAWWDTLYQTQFGIECTELYSNPILGCNSHNLDYTECQENTTGKDDKFLVQAYCKGHRNVNSNISEYPTYVQPQTISTAAVVNKLKALIKVELKARKINGKYSFNSINLADNVQVNEQMNSETLQNFANNLNTFTDSYIDDVDNFNDYILPVDGPSKETEIYATDYNNIVDGLTGMMKDCICYADCNGYYVCWCYGNCYNY